ncbi:hypothetical protein [Streptomonospora wellingtoniae]|uniref:Uncharacterized protein n=1 Tax=Streptomonospora wellingtoniae TaxID=3075544 RepID=A0ABU2KWY8_9ACTN|nr:hypothetical protein [Streptomonospora sp. DSM 45055]MDT0303731.1 hypothetical protein [Streptomonospora sp. DSM 45055]
MWRPPSPPRWRRCGAVPASAPSPRWDLRFSSIAGLDGEAEHAQRFACTTRLPGGVVITGTGCTAAERTRADGTRTSALRFSSDHPLSPVAAGGGHWRYTPRPGGVGFATGYRYRPRWGRVGRAADAWVAGPLMGWATAWSFDRLRLWCEDGTGPERLRPRRRRCPVGRRPPWLQRQSCCRCRAASPRRGAAAAPLPRPRARQAGVLR